MLTFACIDDPSTLTAQVAEVYGSAFSIFSDGPSELEVRSFSDKTLPQQADREGFKFVAAFDHGALVGFIYGFHGERGEPWEEWIHQRLPTEIYDGWFVNQFDLTEFCVRADRHGEGIGSQLYERLFADITANSRYERSVLTTRRIDNPARAFYLLRGWQVIWEALDPRFSLFGLRLPNTATS